MLTMTVLPRFTFALAGGSDGGANLNSLSFEGAFPLALKTPTRPAWASTAFISETLSKAERSGTITSSDAGATEGEALACSVLMAGDGEDCAGGVCFASATALAGVFRAAATALWASANSFSRVRTRSAAELASPHALMYF